VKDLPGDTPAPGSSTTPGAGQNAAPGAAENAGRSAAQTAPPNAGQAEAEAAKAAQAKREADEAATRGAAEKLGVEIKQILAQAAPGTIPKIEVSATSEGVLVSLTDDYEFGMFAIASAEPRPATVAVMDKLAKVLAGLPERLVVRGHTDGRPYRSGTYDNWRLSTARAHMATYMLVRGGIDEKRFERVEGHADRNLKVPNNPDAAPNRRIEILLRKAKS
jgi:chemotaxis protein MotB